MEESDGFKYLILVNEEWYIATSKDKEEQLHSGLQNEENLSSSEKNLDETFEKEFKSLMNHHVEPPWRTPVTKEWSIEMKEKLKTQGEDLQWLDGSPWWYNCESLEL